MPVAAGHVHHLATGAWLVFFAFLVSVVGCVVGLACTRQARRGGEGGVRVGWLVLAAVSIGGVGVWLMHFIAMLGFDTPGLPVRYDIARTAISAVLSVGAVFVGLVVFGVRAPFAPWRLLVGGLIMGLAANLAHYTGMWAVRVQGRITYDAALLLLSIGFAVVTAVAVLLFTVLFDSPLLRGAASLVMGAAFTGMHYLGMAAVEVRIDTTAPTPTGIKALTFLLPVLGLAIVALAIPVYAVLMTSTLTDGDDPHAEAPPAPPVPSQFEPPPLPQVTTTGRIRGVAGYARQPTIPADRGRSRR